MVHLDSKFTILILEQAIPTIFSADSSKLVKTSNLMIFKLLVLYHV